MNRLKKAKFLLLALLLSFTFTVYVNAENPSKGTTVLVSQGGSNPNSNLKYQFETKKPDGSIEKKYINSMYFFGIKASNGKVYQAYCIEPGVSLVTGLSTSYSKSYKLDEDSKKASNKKTLLGYILTVGHAVGVKDTETKYRSAINSLSGTNYYKALATQAIIWEIMSGERTNFNNIGPDNDLKNGFYNVIYKNKSKGTK